MTWITALGVVAAGFASGILAGMFGIGGAVVSKPSIRLLGATPIEAVGSTVPAVLPGAISGTIRYARAGVVDWRVGLVCGGTGSLLAVGGAWIADQINAHYLMIATAGVLAWSGISMIRASFGAAVVVPVGDEESVDVVLALEDDAPPPAGAHRLSALAAVGAVAGFIAGLLGVGGGIILMPLFTTVLRIPIKVAIASSLVAVAIFSVPSLVTHTLLGHVNWAFAGCLMVGVVPGAQVGSALTLGASDHVVRRLFGIFLLVIAVLYGSLEIVALLAS